jgi:hypothetical protein
MFSNKHEYDLFERYQLYIYLLILTNDVIKVFKEHIPLNQSNRMLDEWQQISILYEDSLSPFSNPITKRYIARFPSNMDARRTNEPYGLDHNRKRTKDSFGLLYFLEVYIYSYMMCSCSIFNDFQLLA